MKSNILFFCFMLCSIITSIPSREQAVNTTDSLALVDLYNSTNGPAWYNHTNWLTGPVSTWYGITVTDTRVTSVFINYNKLTGTIPSSFGNLASITVLSLVGNQLSGTIPSSLGNLVNLTGLYLDLNQLSGSIPSSLGNLINLLDLGFAYNQLSGSIPSSLGNLVNLTGFYLHDNQLSGSIPASFGNLASLIYLDLTFNQLSGSIPVELGNLVNIGDLSLNNNQLSGSIPPFSSSFGTDNGFFFVNLSNNRLSGSIPTELGNVAHLGLLNLDNNELSGTVPAELGNLVNLFTLTLSNNQLSGSIPSEFAKPGNLANLQRLDLSNNQLSGLIPASFENLTKLGYLNLSNNQFSGIIPPELGNLISVSELYLNNNQLKGKVPSTIGNMRYLHYLDLSHNKLWGKIPASIATLETLYALDLSYNHFTFDGMELIAQKFWYAKYDHQKSTPLHLNNNTIAVSAGGTLSMNTYKWYTITETDQKLIAVIHGDSVFHPRQSGTYIARITNSIATKLILHSDTISFIAPPVTNNVTASSQNTLKANNDNILLVYPNPAQDILHIQNTGKATIALTDQSGKIVLTKTINSNGAMNVSDLPAGMYYLKNNETGAMQKVMITK